MSEIAHTVAAACDPAVQRRDLNAEPRIQAAIVQWVCTVAPGVLIFAVPNGRPRTKTEAARMRRTGALAGQPATLARELPPVWKRSSAPTTEIFDGTNYEPIA